MRLLRVLSSRLSYLDFELKSLLILQAMQMLRSYLISISFE